MRIPSPLSLCAILLTACSTPAPNYSPVRQEISEPALGSINTTSIGDVLVRQGAYIEHDAIQVTTSISAGLYTIHPGIYLKTGDAPGQELFFPGGSNPGRVTKSAFADDWSYVIIKKENPPRICVLTSYNSAITTCSAAGGYTRTKVESQVANSFQQTLIYNGKVGNKLNIGYREFSNSLARPAFNNNVEYDLSEGSLIRYKGAELQIIEATNQYLRFKLIKNFNAAER